MMGSRSSSSSTASREGGRAGSPDAPLIDPRLGKRLQGRYWIRSLLATGATATVYRRQRLGVGRPVASTSLSAAVAAQEAFFDQFRNEVRALSRVCHPN